MVAGHVVVLDAVLVKVVEHGEAVLVALAVVGLTSPRPAKKERGCELDLILSK